jgi:ParB-like chromosome segregation protein Spo0J
MTEQLINLDFIDDNPEQYREIYKDIEELGRNIATYGLKDVPPARQSGNRYQLESGHRRKRAFLWLHKNYKKEGLPERYSGYTMMPLNVKEITDEEMFDGLIIENAHRDDLKITEKAWLLRRYKEVHPEATSEQIGLVFNMNAATVRGMDIFLDLPKEVQAKLDDGTITQGTARTLHSMQRVASQKMIVETLKEIEKGDEQPDYIIDNTVDQLENVVDLWNDNHREGKPRAGYHGWLLDMKNFPNKLLPALEIRETTDAIGAKNTKGVWKWINEGGNDADHGLEIGLVEKLEHLVNPPACTACPFYTKIRGSHYCGMKLCYTRKTEAWMLQQLEQTSKSTGISLYAESDGRYVLLASHDDKCNALFTKRHADLRLLPKSKFGGYSYQSFKGIDDDVCYVVATGDTIAKLGTTTAKSGGGQKTEKEKAEMRAMKVYRAHRKELVWEFAGVAKHLLDGVPFNVLERLERNIQRDDRPLEEEPSDEAKLTVRADYLRKCMIYEMLIGESSYFRRESMADILECIQEQIKESGGWGVKIPKALIKQAAEWDAEIEAIVAVETGKGSK